MEPVLHTLQLPVSRAPKKFKAFLDSLGYPCRLDCFGQFHQGRITLFSAAVQDSETGAYGSSASITPREGLSITAISRFISKLNVALSLSSTSRDVFIETCGTEENAVLVAKIVVKNLPSQMALSNIWAVIDSSNHIED